MDKLQLVYFKKFLLLLAFSTFSGQMAQATDPAGISASSAPANFKAQGGERAIPEDPDESKVASEVKDQTVGPKEKELLLKVRSDEKNEGLSKASMPWRLGRVA